ncbi:ABC transporter ATP-binding protein [Natronobacterium gregoryi]|uniref:Cobalamin import ATP-binding protein BtuD n=2 Tax=Natronobacterium gregoryi TaxID=44930 RepID=L0AI25_NATGS|nr:ABC transporter ATP-binding protein [Natronobacterium gregoryi]AFZ73461.1 ABC-type cobalamin/Fe3+-siderophore transport system, ATPase component [Natronobacterium gregoryi SP2]ELY68659.1 Iron-chelate-transporting ATPase [Natronobacterium gregoryi SP2]PLK20468.1 ABC transporter ATP-binding protein [Natronobacterium gregoryi SP2]SFI71412.1 iron complex transport system ATP-binding protein [Natronobacterium gregoryi]
MAIDSRLTTRDDAESAAPETDDPPYLTGTDLRIGYPNAEEPVLDGESVTVPEGEVTALIGPNGSGKSTLLKGIARQLSLESGTVFLEGNDVHDLEKKAFARKVGHLSQENVSPDGLTVAELVYHGRYPHRGFFESVTDEDQAAVDRAISLAGIGHLRDRPLGSLSGGQKQLVWIAMALAQETDVLLLDEPTTFLDVHHQLEVMEIVETLRDHSSVTVVLVLHDIEQAARYADHLVALEDGSIYASGPPDDTLTEALLADVFRIEADVEEGERGPTITPLGPLHEDSSDESVER